MDDEELFYNKLENGSMSKKTMIKLVQDYTEQLSKLNTDKKKDQTKEKDLMQRLEALRKEMENEQKR